MNHKQFNHWIKNEEQLPAKQQMALQNHLKICKECQQLQLTYQMSKKLILEMPLHSPTPGFTKRWQKYLAKKKQQARITQLRSSVLGITLLVLLSLVLHILTTGSFTHWVARIFNSLTVFVFSLANSLANIEQFIRKIPTEAQIIGGMFAFSILNAVFIILILVIYSYLRKEKLFYETNIN